MSDIRLEVKGLKELQKKLTKEVIVQPFNAGIKKITLALQREVTVATPSITGRLRASITPKLTEENGIFQGLVGTNVLYATSVEYGTQPHIIRPKTKKALRFFIGGQEVFAKFVRHPGSQARHVTEGSSVRVKGEGMFAFGLKQVQEKMGEYLKEIGLAIEQRWNK